MMNGTCGLTSPRQFALYDPDTSCWRTWPAIGLWGSTELSQTWPKHFMTCGGRAFELQMSAHPTAGNGSSSLLPTPRTSDTNGPGEHGTGGPDLRTVVGDLLPTPVTQPDTGNGHARNLGKEVQLLPTPRASDGTKGGPNQRGSSGDLMLPSVVQLLPTPSVADGMGGHRSRSGDRSDELLLPGIVLTLLPTPTAQAAKHSMDDRGPGTLDDFNLWTVAGRIGDPTRLQSHGGNEPSAGEAPHLLSEILDEADSD
jgi:hypothetical protein